MILFEDCSYAICRHLAVYPTLNRRTQTEATQTSGRVIEDCNGTVQAFGHFFGRAHSTLHKYR